MLILLNIGVGIVMSAFLTKAFRLFGLNALDYPITIGAFAFLAFLILNLYVVCGERTL